METNGGEPMQETFLQAYNEAKAKGIIYGKQKNKAGLEFEIIAMKANLSEGGQNYKTCPIKSLIPPLIEILERGYNEGYKEGFNNKVVKN